MSSRVFPGFCIGFTLAFLLAGHALAQPAETESDIATGAPAQAPAGLMATDRTGAAEAAGELTPPDDAGRYLYIVRFSEPALAAYRGGIESFAATSPRATGQRRIDFSAPEVQAYLGYLENQQAGYLAEISDSAGRTVTPEHQFLNVLNAATLRLTEAEARTVEALEFVRSVNADRLHELDTDQGPALIGAPSIWDGATTSGESSRGEGVLVGIIDSGINHAHPSFAEEADDGYVHENPFGTGNFVGVCDPDHPDHIPGFCNDKLVGAYALHPNTDDPGAEPGDNHGSHVASIAAGNPVEANLEFGEDNIVTRDISGVAPRANVIQFKVCFPTCPTSASVQAVDLGIQHGVDVLNYSISGSDNPWVNDIDQAFLDAFDANIFVSASAGNDGPGASTVAKTGPWNASVGNSTHDRIFANGVDAAGIEDIAVLQGTGPLLEETVSGPVVDVAEDFPDNPLGCDAYPAADSLEGAIPLMARGDCPFADKIDNAHDAGAVAVLVFNNTGGPPIVMGGAEDTQISSAMMDILAGQALQDAIAAATDPEATFYPEVDAFFESAWQDIMSNTSSRGPSQFDILKPDFTGPGSNILAAYGPDSGGDPLNYGVTGGTSMSSPHTAGSAAIMRGIQPDWSPAEIKSAIALTADPEVLDTDGITPADFFDMGAGRLDLTLAGTVGFVLDETHENYVAANPAIGGDPRTLNQPYMMNRECMQQCGWERTITSVQPVDVEWTVSFEGPSGMDVEIVPDSFTLEAGESQTLQINADVSDLPLSEWTFGRLVFEPANSATEGVVQPVPESVMPVIVQAQEATEGPQISFSPPVFNIESLPNTTFDETLTIENPGSETLDWEITGVVGEAGRSAVLWEQQQAASNGIVSTFFEDEGDGTGAYSSDDFVLSADASLSTILVEGFLGGDASSFDHVTSIHWKLYADDDGQPIGNPEDDPGAEVWSFSTTPDGTGVDLSGENILLDLDAATGSSLDLDAGHYWLVVYLSQPGEVSGDRWNWYAGGPEQLELPKLVTPGSAFDGAYPDWTDITEVNEVFTGLAFTLTGTIECQPDLPGWLSIDPTSGSVGGSSSEDVILSIDTSGLEGGDYQAQVCVESNADNAPFAIVPVNLTVLDQPEADISPESFDFTVTTGASATDSMEISNLGSADLQWDALGPVSPRGNGNVLYESGPVITHPGDGPGGTDHSILQNSSLGMTTLGSNVSVPTFRVADSFEVEDSWLVETMSFFVYQTGSGTESTIDHVNLRIWNGPPDDPDSQVVFGDTDTNRLVDTDWIEGYRVSETTVDENRPIMEAVAGLDVFLPAGTYWVDVQFDGTVASGPWMPPITITGETTTGNALFRNADGWGDWVDGGTETNQGVAFVVRGSAGEGCYDPAEVDWLELDPSSGTVGPEDTQSALVTVDSAGLAEGTYETVLCVYTNDPDAPLWDIPVSLEVEEATGAALVEGTVMSQGYCSDNPAEAAGAGIVIEGQLSTYTAMTDAQGFYQVSVPVEESPVSVTAVADGHLTLTASDIDLIDGQTSVVDLDLVLDAPCATVTPDQLDFALAAGGEATESVVIGNVDGGATLTWWLETGGSCYDPGVDTWLTLAGELELPDGGGNFVAAGSTQSVLATASAEDLEPGIYETELCIGTDDDEADSFTVAVALEVLSSVIFEDRFEAEATE